MKQLFCFLCIPTFALSALNLRLSLSTFNRRLLTLLVW
jgi:hypothetical protein